MDTIPEPWASFDSIEAFDASEMRPGRFGVQMDGGRFEALYLPGEGDRLFVFGAGARDPKTQPAPRFERWKWASRFPGHKLYLADPMAYLDPDMRVGWFLGNKKTDWLKSSSSLIESVCAHLKIPTRSVITYGSSAGGFFALRAAAELGDATAIAINPQTNALRYLQPFVQRVLRTCFEVTSEEDLSEEEFRRFDAIAHVGSSASMRCLIVQNVVDKHHYDRHYLPFVEQLGIPVTGGRNADGRVRSLVYDHPSGHGAEPKSLVPEIISTALELSDL